MNIMYFSPDLPDNNSKKTDKGLISPNKVMENSKQKAYNMQVKNSGLLSKNEGKLLTNDGREIFNENKHGK